MAHATAPRSAVRRTSGQRQTTAGWIAAILFATLIGLGVLGAIVVVAGYLSLSRGLVDPTTLEQIQLPEVSIIYDRTGKVELARFGDQQRDVVTFDQIPPIVLDATTAVEDKSFWTNSGFDPAAILASAIDAVRGNARGASTITQQLVRQRLLDPALVQAPGRTVERKLKEIIQSIRLTRAFPGLAGKERIITAYLNQNFYGNNTYGVKAAARAYFGKDLKDLTVAQAAILAGIPQSPSTYDLVRNAVAGPGGKLIVPPTADVVVRRDFILDLLASGRTPRSDGTYSSAQFEAAKSDPVVLAPQTAPRWIAPHFVWAVRDELTKDLCGEAQTCPELERGGLRIITTLDVRLQKVAEKWVAAAAIVPKAKDPVATAKALGLTYAPWMKNLRNKDVNNGALVATDYQTGEIVAYVGSADYYATNGSPQFQPKFDVAGHGYRQPGSTFKPFNYVTGIDEHTFTAATMFMDVTTDFGGGYIPTDADLLERGPVRVRNALQFSLNIPAVKALAVNGVDHVFSRAKDYGLQFRTATTDAGLSLTLGVAEVRPVDLATAYGTIADAGQYVAHTTILSVKDRTGATVIPDYVPAPKQVVGAGAAAIVTDILAGNTDPAVNPFWGQFQILDGKQRRPATLKTGTNNDAKDLNADGFIAPPTAAGRAAGEYALTVEVWNGNSDNTPVSTAAAPVFSIDVSTYVFQGFMTEATKGWGINQFSRPADVVTAPIDPWTGLKPAPGGPSITELFLQGTQPTTTAGGSSGVCGDAVFQAAGFESRFPAWLAADRAWLSRAQRGTGIAGGPKNTRTSYFYDGSFTPFGRSWGPLLNGAGCTTPAPPSCIPLPTPDSSGNIPPIAPPTQAPGASGPLAALCPAPSQAPATPTPSPTPAPTGTPPPTPPPPSIPVPSLPLPTLNPTPNPPTPAPSPAPSA